MLEVEVIRSSLGHRGRHGCDGEAHGDGHGPRRTGHRSWRQVETLNVLGLGHGTVTPTSAGSLKAGPIVAYRGLLCPKLVPQRVKHRHSQRRFRVDSGKLVHGRRYGFSPES